MTLFVDTTPQAQVTFRDYAGVAKDPTTIVVRYQDESGSITSSTYPSAGWGHPATGVYTFAFAVDAAGTWKVSFEGTGVVDAYNEAEFVVTAKGF